MRHRSVQVALFLTALVRSPAAVGVALVVLVGAGSGCLGLSLAGEAVRSGQKEINVVYAPGVAGQALAHVRNFGVSVNGVDASGVTVAAGQGATNTNVYSDLIAGELFKRGLYATALPEPVTELSDPALFGRLRERGVEVVLVGSVNLSATASVFSGMTGGDWSNTGVTAFTIRALSAADGRALFIVSGRYGTSKKANVVMKDFGEVLGHALAGTVEEYRAGRNGRGDRRRDAEPAVAPPPPVLPVPAPPPAAAPAVPERALPLLDLATAQRTLNRLGYTCGTADGVLGARTRACLRAFQRAEDLGETGALDRPTSDAVRRRTDAQQ